MSALDPYYTVIIRVPFPRGDFVDPPFVEWDALKDKQLWKILSNTSKNIDIDWNKLAMKFHVPLAFLLQQVACLYEHQMQQVQAQIRKARDVKGLSSPVTAGLKSDSTGEGTRVSQGVVGMLREPIAPTKNVSITAPRVSSGLANTRDATNTNETLISRNSSANTTITSLDLKQTSPSAINIATNRGLGSSILQDKSSSNLSTLPRPSRLSTPSPSGSSTLDSSSGSELPLNPLLRRPARFSEKLAQSKFRHEDEDELVFMPFDSQNQDHRSNTSSTNDADDKLSPEQTMSKNISQQSEVLDSPKINIADIYKNSQVKDKFRESNDGIPSINSSFSDIDVDTSITQSALEEALASKMQAGGMASRMSSISQALKSKYL